MQLKAALRSLARARGLSVAVVLTLSLGIAALTTTLGIVNAEHEAMGFQEGWGKALDQLVVHMKQL